MNLTTLEIHGYRKFSQPVSIYLYGKLVCLVGPNEAGKTSLLDAILHLNHDEPFETCPNTYELSRGEAFQPSHNVLTAKFLLDENDHQSLKEVENTSKAKWFIVQKTVDGRRRFAVVPTPQRNLSRVEGCLSIARTLQAKSHNGDWPMPDFLENENYSLEELIEELESEGDCVSGEALRIINLVLDEIDEEDKLEPEISSLISSLEDLRLNDSRSLQERAVDVLHKRMPRFLKFSTEELNLESTYDLETQLKNPPLALRNLGAFAETDLSDLHTAVHSNPGKKLSLLKSANHTVTKKLNDLWTQSHLDFEMDDHDGALQIMVRSDGGEFQNIAERSQGFRQFVALAAFVESQGGSLPPTILIDEAETHLHYDAQSDLVQLLEKQELASKVIYTTHSIGCLPEDLGQGIRLVKPRDSFSEIVNKFWSEDEPGFAPLLFGMGAMTLAFFSIRHALIVEGPSDHILLPHLLREAIQSDYLGFQVVPGLSESNEESLLILHSHGSRTAYLTDADEGGDKIREWLIKLGISKRLVKKLPSAKGQRVVLEDFVDKWVYVDAVNKQLEIQGTKKRIEATDVGNVNRPRDVNVWCDKVGARHPDKVGVAYWIIEQAIQDLKICNKQRIKSLKKIYRDIIDVIGDDDKK